MDFDTIRHMVKLVEIFDDPAPIQFNTTTGYAYFTVDEYVFGVGFEDIGNDHWEIGFNVITKNGVDIRGLADWDTQLLGRRKTSVKIFSSVIDAVKTWVKKVNPTSFGFSSDDAKRGELYNKIVNALEDNIRSELGYRVALSNGKWIFHKFGKTAFGMNESFEIDLCRQLGRTIRRSILSEMREAFK